MQNVYRDRALRLVREAYEAAARMQHVDVERLNQTRPPSARHLSRESLIREFLSTAGAVSTFAVNLALITPQEAAQIILDFQAAHPDLGDCDEDREWLAEWEVERRRSTLGEQ